MRIDDDTVDLSPEEGARVVALALVSETRAAAEHLGADAEALHGFRVAVRRLRSTLRAFRPWLADGIRPRHEKRIRRLARSTNAARDAEVQLAWIAEQRASLASERQRAGLDLVLQRLQERAGEGRPSPRVADRYLRLADKLELRLRTYQRRIGGVGGTSFGGALAALASEQVDALVDRMGAIRGPSDEATIHRARIEGKRLRYLLEPLHGNRHADASDAIDRLKRLQDVLGDLHDTHVLVAELADTFAEEAAKQARRTLDSIFELAAKDGSGPGRTRASPRGGLLALARLVRERRDALYGGLERERGAGGMDALVSEVRSIAAALEARAGGKLERERKHEAPPR